MLVRLMYASRAVAGADSAELGAILKHSKHHNAEHGITGVLCFAQGQFVQVLEGGRPAVNALYQRILADPRHEGVQLLGYEEIDERRYAGWAMGQVNLARLNPALLLKYGEQPVLDPFALSARAATALFDDLMATASIVGQS